MERKPRFVYSTERGRLCPVCGWPESDCRCSASGTAKLAVPAKIVARLRMEKRGGGKTITVIDGLPDNHAFLDPLARELKRACGTGGSAGAGLIELQGDQRERLRELLAKKRWTVKG